MLNSYNSEYYGCFLRTASKENINEKITDVYNYFKYISINSNVNKTNNRYDT